MRQDHDTLGLPAKTRSSSSLVIFPSFPDRSQSVGSRRAAWPTEVAKQRGHKGGTKGATLSGPTSKQLYPNISIKMAYLPYRPLFNHPLATRSSDHFLWANQRSPSRVRSQRGPESGSHQVVAGLGHCFGGALNVFSGFGSSTMDETTGLDLGWFMDTPKEAGRPRRKRVAGAGLHTGSGFPEHPGEPPGISQDSSRPPGHGMACSRLPFSSVRFPRHSTGRSS